MAKSNRKIGFSPLYGSYLYERGARRAWAVADEYPGALSLGACIGTRAGVYRVYARLWRCDRDASREGIAGEFAARGMTPDEAIHAFEARCTWHARSVRHVASILREDVAKLGAQA